VEGNYLVLSGCTVVKNARMCVSLTGGVVIIVILLWSSGWDGMDVILSADLPPHFAAIVFLIFEKL